MYNKTASPPAQSESLKYQPAPNDPKKDDDDPTPRPLSRPLGLPNPPQPGDNVGQDGRTLRQKRDDFVNYEKHLERRQKMTKQISRPYFKDFSDMRFSKGKTFIAPERILKGEHALYFPNLRGKTLAGPKEDTTAILLGKVSVVSVLSSGWAENQVRTFCSKEENPQLHSILETETETAQLVEINHEPNFLKYWILRLFSYRLKSQKPSTQWPNYFIVRRGFFEPIRESLAIVNQRVGYVYLLDPQCRVRWAGSAVADASEKASLVKGLRRLLQEAKSSQEARIQPPAEAEGGPRNPDPLDVKPSPAA